MMSKTQPPTFKVEELERLVKRVEPAAFLVPPRLLRRIIKHHRKVDGIGLLLPHSHGYVIDREALLRCVLPAELGLAARSELPPHAFLMVRPSTDQLARDALVKHWRILFHLHIDHTMQQKLDHGSLTPTLVRQRIRKLGLIEFAEIMAVLHQERYLLPPESTEAVYAEFVAVYLTLRRFDQAQLPGYFPALRNLAAVDALVAEDIRADAIYDATRLPGAPDPVASLPRITQADGSLELAPVILSFAPTLFEEDNPYSAKPAKTAEMDRNEAMVRETILSIQADKGAILTLADARSALNRLGERLKNALGLSENDAENWRIALQPLLVMSAHSSWNQEARFLYDLQSACVDSEQGIYTVDLVEWALSLGELPIRRHLPAHQQVAIIRALRRAMDRLTELRLTEAERQNLRQQLVHALEHREHWMRESFRPLIASAMNDTGMKAHNLVEDLGRTKLIEELLDRVVEFGHFNMGTLRDGIARNQLKLPDLKGPAELVQGDPLIRLNRKLAVVLDGVYRRGEIYLRLLHRLSSVAFGTGSGRLVVLFLILPFGLAFFVMITPGIALEEGAMLTQWVGQMAGLVEKLPAPRGHAARHRFPLPSLWGVTGLGVFFLLIFHVGGFRRGLYYGMSKVGYVLRTVFIQAPIWLVYLPALQALLHNRFWRLFRRFVLWPVLMATTGGLIAWWYNLETPAIAGIATGCLALGIGLLNTRLGRDVEETVADGLLGFWAWLSTDFAPGLLHLIMDVSRWCLEAIEQVLYTVNAWLRFHSGQNRVVVVIKGFLGLLWFWVTYIIRFVVNLLIEPQVNPLKHFPMVTVAHKVCLPMTPIMRNMLIAQFGLSRPRALALAGGIITGIPGIFGFVVWELKENWKLYNSNRASDLGPVSIGSHGETMLRLLRPGFHSGTIPTLYKRLRRAEQYGQPETARKIRAALNHVSENVARFVERELLALLRRCKGWGGLAIALEAIGVATNRVLVKVSCPAMDAPPLVLAFDHRSGWLLACVLEPGWQPLLSASQQPLLAAGLTGLYKMAGVHLTREQIEECLPPTIFAYDITDAGLVVWNAVDMTQDVVYDLSAGPELPPTPLHGALPTGMPVLDARRLLFTNVPLTWHDWLRTWEGDQATSSD